MARTVAQIQAQIDLAIAANPALAGLTSPSQVAYYQNWANTMAIELAIEEQLRDTFQTEIETDIANAPPGTPQWIIQQLKAFQYSATTPQVVSVNGQTFTISYPIINSTYQVIANAAVITNPNKQVLIKVAPINPDTVFDGAPGTSGPTMQALTSYLDLINFAGVQFSIINALPDLFLIGANIWYDGQYAATIQAAVNTAIANYLSTLPFNGLITLMGGQSDPALIGAIMDVPGVTDVELLNVSIRPNTVAVGSATYLVESAQTIYRNYGTYSGRAIVDSGNQGTGIWVLNFNVG